MKRTDGFVTDDGTFFEEESEAKLYECEWRLRNALAREFPNLTQEFFFAIVFKAAAEIREYIDAYNANHAKEPNTDTTDHVEVGEEVEDSTSTETHDSLGHVSAAEEDLASILKLQVRRPGNVSDVGSGTSTEEVSDRSALDGS